MARLEIACSQCGQRLKVPDPSMLGRKARCGKCGHQFVMEISAVRPRGKRARPATTGSIDAPLEFADLARLQDGGPQIEATHRPAAADAKAPAPRFDQMPVKPGTLGEFPSLDDDAAPPFEGIDLLPVADSEPEFFSRDKLRKSSAGRFNTLVGVGVALVLLGGAVTYFAMARSGQSSRSASGSGSSEVAARGQPAPPAEVVAPHAHRERPPRGRPLTLRYVPMGARIVVCLRPAELWKAGSAGEEFRACLGPLGLWLESRLKALCVVDPSAIETVLFALIPSSRETFDVATVVRTCEEVKRSELLDKISGELVQQPRPHYVRDKTAYFLPDARTIAIAPRELADSMLEAAESGGEASEGIQALLPRTDGDRHFTLLAELEDVRNAAETIAPANARGLLNAAIEFFGDDVETVAMALHLGNADAGRDLFAQALIRNRVTRSPPHLRDDLQKRLAKMPVDLLHVVYRTNPRKLGEKKIVGRFPVMTKVVEQSAVFQVSRRMVSLECQLPERAGPNLALGALLTWNQTTLPDYGTSSSPPLAARDNRAALPATIAERLQKKIDVEFRDDFLYVAVAFIGEEIGVEFKLDGTGMKRAGITQNEKQKFTMEKTPAIAILDRILSPRKLVLIVDEQKKTATITGVEEAADKKLQPFPLNSKSGE